MENIDYVDRLYHIFPLGSTYDHTGKFIYKNGFLKIKPTTYRFFFLLYLYCPSILIFLLNLMDNYGIPLDCFHVAIVFLF